MSIIVGYCPRCQRNYPIPDTYNGLKHFAVCPDCDQTLQIKTSAIADTTKVALLENQ